MAAKVFDPQGLPIALGAELGRGGEGIVLDVQGRPDSVAKLYLKPPSPELGAKLAAMASMAEERLLRQAAWPMATLHGPGGGVVGFTMPKVAGHHPVFQLYGPKLRLLDFPRADWRFLIHAAANAARAFSVVHAAGLVVGDVNHSNLMVAQDATTRFIDCDSFQVSRGGRTWFCEVGVGTHQPPEMQGRPSYKGIVRTPNHDNFGLAVFIFQLLCMGRHPFMGRHAAPGDPPTIEEAIAQSRYAFSTDRGRTRLTPPPGSLPVDVLPPTIQRLFEEAFAPSSARSGRPAGDRWATALGELAGGLRQCVAQRSHFYPAAGAVCPWCAIEAASGRPLFPVVFAVDAATGSGMIALWQEVAGLAAPPPLPPPPDPRAARVAPSPAVAEFQRRRKRERAIIAAAYAAAFVAILSLAPAGGRMLALALATAAALAAFYVPRDLEVQAARDAFAKARDDWAGLEAAWQAVAPGPGFADVRKALDVLKARHDGLPAERARLLQRLHEQRREAQLTEHLDRIGVVSARISGVGPAKMATLMSYGVATAGDVSEARVLAIPGFGPVTTGRLVAWRQGCERLFRFDPGRGVAPADVAGVGRDLAAQRHAIERDVATGLAQLKGMIAAAASRRRLLEGRAAEVAPRFAQAMADARAIRAWA